MVSEKGPAGEGVTTSVAVNEIASKWKAFITLTKHTPPSAPLYGDLRDETTAIVNDFINTLPEHVEEEIFVDKDGVAPYDTAMNDMVGKLIAEDEIYAGHDMVRQFRERFED